MPQSELTMDAIHHRTLSNLRNTRDLRAEILSLAAALVARPQSQGSLTVIDPLISRITIHKEWQALLPALVADVRERMTLDLDQPTALEHPRRAAASIAALLLDKPNYRFEVMRLLLGARLEKNGTRPAQGIAAHLDGTQLGLIDSVGASSTPIRRALSVLRDAGLIRNLRWLEIEPQALSMDLLSRIGALPQTLRFRFERGARTKSPFELLRRVEPLLAVDGPPEWTPFALSGTGVAQQDVPGIDVVGTPRLDLVAHVPRGDKAFDVNGLRLLDDALEPEPNVTAPAPVVVTVVRAGTRFDRDAGMGDIRCAHPCDVFLALLDMGLREQALQYARAVRS